MVKIGSLSHSGKIIENRENPYYLTLQLLSNISKKSRAYNFLDINLIFRMSGDMSSRIEWLNFSDNRTINQVLKKLLNVAIFSYYSKNPMTWFVVILFWFKCDTDSKIKCVFWFIIEFKNKKYWGERKNYAFGGSCALWVLLFIMLLILDFPRHFFSCLYINKQLKLLKYIM